MAIKLRKLFLEIEQEADDILVWIEEQVVERLDTDARLTDLGYSAVLALLEGKGYLWNKETEFHYHLYNTAWDGNASTIIVGSEEIILPTGWSVIFESEFLNNEVPPPLWVRDLWVDTPLGGGTITIPGRWETQTQPAIIIADPNIGWNSSAVSNIAFKDDGIATFRIDNASTGVVVGLTLLAKSGDSHGWEDIERGIKSALNSFEIVENGTVVRAAETFLTSDIFTVRRAAGTIIFAKNGVDFYSSSKVLANFLLQLDTSFYEADDAIYDAELTATTTVVTDDPVNILILEFVAPISVPLILEFVAPISVPLILEFVAPISVPLILEFVAPIRSLETIELEFIAPILNTQELVIEFVAPISVPELNTLILEFVAPIVVEEELESVIIDVSKSESPLFGAY